MRKYEKNLQLFEAETIKNGIVAGLIYGFSQFLLFMVFALIFYIGSLFVRDTDATAEEMFIAIFGVIFAASSTGKNTVFLPDIAVSKQSAANLFLILDSTDED